MAPSMTSQGATGRAPAVEEHAARTRRALSLLLGGVLVGLMGVYWDISWHLDKGRDSFFTLPHDLIYGGMLAVLFVTAWALARDRRRSPAHVSVGRFSLQMGLLVGAIGSLLVLAFGPLDELWHQAFGEDLTLWGPMHLVGLAGFTFAALGGIVASVLEDRIDPDGWAGSRWHAIGFATAVVGLMVLHLAEWEYGVPAFPMALHPILLSGLPILALVLVARLDVHPWAATLTALAFTALRGLLHLWLLAASRLDLAGLSRPEIPLLIVTGLVIDLAGRYVRSGAVIGLFGAVATLATNVPINRIDEAYPWTAEIAVPAFLGSLVLGALLGWAGAWIATALGGAGRGDRPPPGGDPGQASAALLALIVLSTALAPTGAAHPRDPSAVDPVGEATVTVASQGPDQPAVFEISFQREGTNVTEGTMFTTLRTADGSILAREPLAPDGDGIYRLHAPLPSTSNWTLRFYHGYGFRLADGIAEGSATPSPTGGVEAQTVPVYSLYPDVPPELNLWGYAAYGAILAGAVLAVVAVLRRIARAPLPAGGPGEGP